MVLKLVKSNVIFDVSAYVGCDVDVCGQRKRDKSERRRKIT